MKTIPRFFLAAVLVFAATQGPVFVHQDIITGKLAGPSFAMMTPSIQQLHPLTFMDDQPALYQRVINVFNC